MPLTQRQQHLAAVWFMSISSFKSSVLFSIRPLCTQISVTLWPMQHCCRAALEVSSGLLYWCRAPLGAVTYFIQSITGVWRPGNIALRAHTGHRWRSKTCRYPEIAQVWGICWSQERFMWEQLNKAPTKTLFWTYISKIYRKGAGDFMGTNCFCENSRQKYSNVASWSFSWYTRLWSLRNLPSFTLKKCPH